MGFNFDDDFVLAYMEQDEIGEIVPPKPPSLGQKILKVLGSITWNSVVLSSQVNIIVLTFLLILCLMEFAVTKQCTILTYVWSYQMYILRAEGLLFLLAFLIWNLGFLCSLMDDVSKNLAKLKIAIAIMVVVIVGGAWLTGLLWEDPPSHNWYSYIICGLCLFVIVDSISLFWMFHKASKK